MSLVEYYSNLDSYIVYNHNHDIKCLYLMIFPVTELSMAALQMKLKKLELQHSKKEPKFKIISRGAHNRKIFNRMVC